MACKTLGVELDLRMRAVACAVACGVACAIGTLGAELDLRMRAVAFSTITLGAELDVCVRAGLCLRASTRGAVENKICCCSFSTTIEGFVLKKREKEAFVFNR